ncbi:MAG: hypothetical protein ACYC2K_06940 [Gemmatimonadales bacterium]
MLSLQRFRATLSPLVIPALLASCATTGATLGSGVGDVFLERPPHYAGRVSDPAVRTGYLPVVYQRGGSQAPIFDPAPSGDLRELLAEMTAYLDSSGVGPRLGGPAASSALSGKLIPPDVRFGCVTESGAPDADCADRGEGALGRGYQALHLSVGRPSAAWIGWIDSAMVDAQVDRVLLLTVEVGQYWIRQRGLVGHKQVVLGSDHVVGLPWLTSLETPVAVIQLTGALVGRDGKAIRIGAEGLAVRRTPLLVSALGGQALVTDDEISELRSARRTDRPGEPLVWQVAMQAMIAELTGYLANR